LSRYFSGLRGSRSPVGHLEPAVQIKNFHIRETLTGRNVFQSWFPEVIVWSLVLVSEITSLETWILEFIQSLKAQRQSVRSVNECFAAARLAARV
jgi:hypothetical protein